MRLGRTAFSHFLSQVVVTASGFVATWLIAVVLGADGLGLYTVVIALGFYWLVIPANAVGMAVKKRMSEGDSPAAFFGGGLVLNAAVVLVVVPLVLFSGELLGGIVSRDRELMVTLIRFDAEIAALLTAAVAYRTIQAGLQGQQRVAVTGWLKAGERGLRTALQIAALAAGLGVVGISFGHAGSLAVLAAVGLAISQYRPSRPSVDHLRSLLSYAQYAWAGTLRGRVFGWLDTLVLAFFVSASLVGIYEAAWGIASMLAIASASISQTLFPEISDISTDAEYEQIKHYLDEALAFSVIFVIPGLVGATVLGERVLRFYRPEFGQGTGILLILIGAYLADSFASQFLNVINGIDRPDVAFRVNGAFIAFNLALNCLLVWQIGWYGAAIATALSSLLRAIAGYWMLTRILGDLSIPVGQLARQLLAAITMGAVVAPIEPLAPEGRIGTVLLAGVGAGVYAVGLLAIAPRIRSKALGLTQ
jgi:O-antigen/teichoic acid export membrane protein